MARWATWGKDTLRDGDIVFRLGDAKALGGVPAQSVHRHGHRQSFLAHGDRGGGERFAGGL